jgi:electron transport complex protein RnfE
MAATDETSRAYREFRKGIWKENPVFVAALGLCPALAVTNTTLNALVMSLATTFVLVGSSTLISLTRKAIPKQVRISCFIIVIATFVTTIDYVLKAFMYYAHKDLGAFIALIVVNCLILGRQEAFASKNTPGLAISDALGMAGGFTIALTLTGVVREILGMGTVLGMRVLPESFEPWAIMILPPGGFLTMGSLMVLFAYIKSLQDKKREQLELRAADEAAEGRAG